jgi:hypothetical protein
MNLPRKLLLAWLAAVVAPLPARAGLLVAPLQDPLLPGALVAPAPDLGTRPDRAFLALAGDEPAKQGAQGQAPDAPKPGTGAGTKPAASPGDLDFDLLGAAKPPPDAPDGAAMKRRREMLSIHQGVGIGLYALEVGTTVLGQLNYRDKFATHQNTEKWRMPHKVFAYATAAVMVLNGSLALAAPAPVKHPFRLDRVGVHKIAMFTAAACMLAQVGLGVYTHSREGYMDQQGLAKAHLALGYATFAVMTTGVAVLVF